VTPQSFAVVKPRSHARSLIDLSKLDAHQSANTPDYARLVMQSIKRQRFFVRR